MSLSLCFNALRIGEPLRHCAKPDLFAGQIIFRLCHVFSLAKLSHVANTLSRNLERNIYNATTNNVFSDEAVMETGYCEPKIVLEEQVDQTIRHYRQNKLEEFQQWALESYPLETALTILVENTPIIVDLNERTNADNHILFKQMPSLQALKEKTISLGIETNFVFEDAHNVNNDENNDEYDMRGCYIYMHTLDESPLRTKISKAKSRGIDVDAPHHIKD